jgi:hypothetical protein
MIAPVCIAAGCSGQPSDSAAESLSASSSTRATTSPSASDPLGVLFFEDDFSDASAGWPKEAPKGALAQGFELGFADGGYFMRADDGTKISYVLDAPNERSSNNVILEVGVAHAGQHAIYGLFCKADVELANFYVFTLDSPDSWSVAVVQRGHLRPLGVGTDTAIEPGATVNHLRAQCFDNEPEPNAVVELKFWVNGTLVFTGRDRSGLSGQQQSVPGLFFESDFEGDAEVVFDNFAFWGVDPDTLPA